jgi:F-type H+-transporting ATPase subunit epsilon|nr:F-type H+-transporting ATPase subunit epsilon [Vacuolaria virescens]
MVLNVTISAPNQDSWIGTAEKVIITSTTGQIGMLAGHARLVTTVDIGLLLVEKTENDWDVMISFSGIAVVHNNDVQILLNAYEFAPKISEEIAEEEFQQAVRTLSQFKDDPTINKLVLSQAVKTASSRRSAAKIFSRNIFPFS